QSPRSDVDNRDTATVPSLPANSLGTHSADSESHPATAVASDTLGRPPHSCSGYRTPSSSADSLPFPNTMYSSMVSQGDTQLSVIAALELEIGILLIIPPGRQERSL